MFDADGYLRRINYKGTVTPNAETLRDLHLAHLLAVPFENLSRSHGPSVALETEQLFDKIVVRRRGGFCYELNGLFAELLKSLGFQVSMLAARVLRTDGGYGPDFDHLVLLVQCEQRWIADVGFGDAFRLPLLLDEAGSQAQGSDTFRFESDGQDVVLNRLKPGEEWSPIYRFKTIARAYNEFFEMCKYHSISADSPFSKHRIVRMETSEGRVSLTDNKLTITTHGVCRDIQLADAEYSKALSDHFGIVI